MLQFCVTFHRDQKISEQTIVKRVGNIDRIYFLISCTKRVVAIFIDVNRSLITDHFESYM